MECRQCHHPLRVERRCRQIRLQCTQCKKEYHIHELASELDSAMEKELERFTCIIYD
ncbi:MAG: hypothetical protein GX087_08430 [Desulfobulbaceae bacterium]|nr:hypothetical protein [Desulfobulbaceae bacterium]